MDNDRKVIVQHSISIHLDMSCLKVVMETAAYHLKHYSIIIFVEISRLILKSVPHLRQGGCQPDVAAQLKVPSHLPQICM